MSIRYDFTKPKRELVSEILYHNEGFLLSLGMKYERFRASRNGVPIFKREFADETKVNNRINNDFVGDVINTKVGYMMSIPVTYSYTTLADFIKKTKDKEPAADLTSPEQEMLDDFVVENALDDLNMETVKFASICGTSSRLCYINKKGAVALMNVKPWEVVYLYDASGTEVIAAVRYYSDYYIENNSVVERIKAEYYSDEEVFYFVEANGMLADLQISGFKTTFMVDTAAHPAGQQPHGFGYVPLIEYVNNTERQGDCDKVFALIDVYDRCLSDHTSEVEQFRLAYLALYGLEATPEDIAKMKQTGAFKMTKDGKVEFITKDIKASALENLLKQLEENIVKFANSVNFSDKNFSGNLSGIAIKYKLIKLEHKCSVSEVKMKKADRQMWKILGTAFALLKRPFNYLKIHERFTRNLPVNLLEEARIQRELKGLVSTETRLSLASFVENPKQEIAKMKHEMETGVLAMIDEFYETMEEASPDEGTGSDDADYNEWRKTHRAKKAGEEKDEDEE